MTVALVAETIRGVSPAGWIHQPEVTWIDSVLNDYGVVWATAGHPYAVFPTSYSELLRLRSSTAMAVSNSNVLQLSD